jgi:hypothetical protein
VDSTRSSQEDLDEFIQHLENQIVIEKDRMTSYNAMMAQHDVLSNTFSEALGSIKGMKKNAMLGDDEDGVAHHLHGQKTRLEEKVKLGKQANEKLSTVLKVLLGGFPTSKTEGQWTLKKLVLVCNIMSVVCLFSSMYNRL